MKAAYLVSLGALLASGVLAQGAFEPADFSVVDALENNGVNFSAIPELVGLVERSSLGACSITCKSLKVLYGGKKVLSEGTPDYDAFTAAYWSAQQGAVNPSCVFKPSSALEVSTFVLLSRLSHCPFAAKGGGHAAFAGSSSIEGGITLSLENFKQIEVSSDKKTVDIGPGNHWVDVYSSLDTKGLGVVGGRISNVGVPGLILGGGISFFSNKLGWACDNVASYEVVTASGKVVTASPSSYPDFYWALRGGGNNFGVVTNFKLHAFPLGKMWGGSRLFTNDSFPAVLDAIYKFATQYSNEDPDAAQIISFGYSAGFGPLAAAQLDYAKPVANASAFKDFNAIPAVQSTTDIHSLAELTIMMNVGIVYGVRETYWDVSFKVDRDLFTYLVDTFYELLPAIVDAEGILPTISIQAITDGQLKGMQQRGGNALGLDPENGPYFIMNMGCNWNNTADDARILKFHADVINRVKAYAATKGLANDFIYMNYGSQFQDVVSSYGATNKKKLISVSRKYDPTQVFQRLVPGYFKLEGPPNPNPPTFNSLMGAAEMPSLGSNPPLSLTCPWLRDILRHAARRNRNFCPRALFADLVLQS